MIQYTTDRLILRNFAPGDVEDVYAFMSLESTALHEAFEPYTHAQCEEAVRRWQSNDRVWAVELAAEGKVIGSLNYSPQEYGAFEIGYDLHEAYGRKGYATEACRVLVEHIFLVEGGRRITAGCNAGNEASWRLLERLGFRREGLFLEDVAFKKDGAGEPVYVDSYYYGLLRREWEARRG